MCVTNAERSCVDAEFLERCCVGDEGRPLGVALREEASNRSPGPPWHSDATGSPACSSFISNNASTVLGSDQSTTTNFTIGADLDLFGFLWTNNGNAWPGTETAELNEATRGLAPDALIAIWEIPSKHSRPCLDLSRE